MSDHVWMSSERANLFAETYRTLGREVEQMASELPGSPREGLKEEALAIAGALEHLAGRLQSGPVAVRVGPRREIGENTQAWVRGEAGYMRRNQRPQ